MQTPDRLCQSQNTPILKKEVGATQCGLVRAGFGLEVYDEVDFEIVF